MNHRRPALPIDSHLDRIVAALAEHNCLLIEAPPGTGKTTRAAPALLPLASGSPAVVEKSAAVANSAAALPNGKVLLIQPRRIAARAAAARIAAELKVDVGQLVGYQVRFDSKISRASRLIAMTPGILLRQLQSNAVLDDVAIVVLDEFHERSLEYDLLLGMLRRIQLELRPELRLVLMSATLDSQAVGDFLDHPPVVTVTPATYPVTIIHSRFQATASRGRALPGPGRRAVEQCIAVTRQAAQDNEGDILVFLPGVGEIRQVEAALQRDAQQADWQLLTLFGDMPPQDQDRVLLPSTRRKVILATNVAETSLTIDGVRIVVDSGLARVQRIETALGLNMLVLEPISKASADQRAGRAGRTASGICYRLWDEITGRSRAEFLAPEVQRVDLTGGVLQLLCWGETDLAAFPWLTPPTPQAIAQALETLQLLGALQAGEVTPLGRRMNELPIQPRLARLLIAGQALGIPGAAALAAACLSERDVFDRRAHSQGQREATASFTTHECDMTNQVLALQHFASGKPSPESWGALNVAAARNVLRVAEQLKRVSSERDAIDDQPLEQQLQQALLVAFPDRLAKRRAAGDPRGLMVGGRGVRLENHSSVQRSELFLCLDVDAAGIDARVRQASAVELAWLSKGLSEQRDERFFSPTAGAITTRRRLYFLDLMLSETPTETPADEQTALQLGLAAAERFDRLLPAKDKGLQSWVARVRWLARELPDAPLPSLERDPLAQTIAGWCYGMRKLDELKQLPWKELLQGLLTPAARKLLETQAPESVRLPTGRVAILQYELGKPPVLAARIQEFFGWRESPRLAGGRIPLLLHLLAPNGRVQQITDDLASFWTNTYPGVRKELRGRYPKHAWPENPGELRAKPPE